MAIAAAAMTVYCLGSAKVGAMVGQTHAVTTRGIFGALGSALVYPATAHGSSRQAREHEDEPECRKVAKARDAACAAIIAAPMPGAREEPHRLALALLDSGGGHADSTKLAYRWAAAAGAVPARLDHYQARDQLTAPSSRVRAALLRYAYAYALATDEMYTRSRWGEWDARRAAHLDRLQTLAGYQPTEWEQQRLAEVHACADATDALHHLRLHRPHRATAARRAGLRHPLRPRPQPAGSRMLLDLRPAQGPLVTPRPGQLAQGTASRVEAGP